MRERKEKIQSRHIKGKQCVKTKMRSEEKANANLLSSSSSSFSTSVEISETMNIPSDEVAKLEIEDEIMKEKSASKKETEIKQVIEEKGCEGKNELSCNFNDCRSDVDDSNNSIKNEEGEEENKEKYVGVKKESISEEKVNNLTNEMKRDYGNNCEKEDKNEEEDEENKGKKENCDEPDTVKKKEKVNINNLNVNAANKNNNGEVYSVCLRGEIEEKNKMDNKNITEEKIQAISKIKEKEKNIVKNTKSNNNDYDVDTDACYAKKNGAQKTSNVHKKNILTCNEIDKDETLRYNIPTDTLYTEEGNCVFISYPLCKETNAEEVFDETSILKKEKETEDQLKSCDIKTIGLSLYSKINNGCVYRYSLQDMNNMKHFGDSSVKPNYIHSLIHRSIMGKSGVYAMSSSSTSSLSGNILSNRERLEKGGDIKDYDKGINNSNYYNNENIGIDSSTINNNNLCMSPHSRIFQYSIAELKLISKKSICRIKPRNLHPIADRANPCPAALQRFAERQHRRDSDAATNVDMLSYGILGNATSSSSLLFQCGNETSSSSPFLFPSLSHNMCHSPTLSSSLSSPSTTSSSSVLPLISQPALLPRPSCLPIKFSSTGGINSINVSSINSSSSSNTAVGVIRGMRGRSAGNVSSTPYDNNHNNYNDTQQYDRITTTTIDKNFQISNHFYNSNETGILSSSDAIAVNLCEKEKDKRDREKTEKSLDFKMCKRDKHTRREDSYVVYDGGDIQNDKDGEKCEKDKKEKERGILGGNNSAGDRTKVMWKKVDKGSIGENEVAKKVNESTMINQNTLQHNKDKNKSNVIGEKTGENEIKDEEERERGIGNGVIRRVIDYSGVCYNNLKNNRRIEDRKVRVYDDGRVKYYGFSKEMKGSVKMDRRREGGCGIDGNNEGESVNTEINYNSNNITRDHNNIKVGIEKSERGGVGNINNRYRGKENISIISCDDEKSSDSPWELPSNSNINTGGESVNIFSLGDIRKAEAAMNLGIPLKKYVEDMKKNVTAEQRHSNISSSCSGEGKSKNDNFNRDSLDFHLHESNAKSGDLFVDEEDEDELNNSKFARWFKVEKNREDVHKKKQDSVIYNMLSSSSSSTLNCLSPLGGQENFLKKQLQQLKIQNGFNSKRQFQNVTQTDQQPKKSMASVSEIEDKIFNASHYLDGNHRNKLSVNNNVSDCMNNNEAGREAGRQLLALLGVHTPTNPDKNHLDNNANQHALLQQYDSSSISNNVSIANSFFNSLFSSQMAGKRISVTDLLSPSHSIQHNNFSISSPNSESSISSVSKVEGKGVNVPSFSSTTNSTKQTKYPPVSPLSTNYAMINRHVTTNSTCGGGDKGGKNLLLKLDYSSTTPTSCDSSNYKNALNIYSYINNNTSLSPNTSSLPSLFNQRISYNSSVISSLKGGSVGGDVSLQTAGAYENKSNVASGANTTILGEGGGANAYNNSVNKLINGVIGGLTVCRGNANGQNFSNATNNQLVNLLKKDSIVNANNNTQNAGIAVVTGGGAMQTPQYHRGQPPPPPVPRNVLQNGSAANGYSNPINLNCVNNNLTNTSMNLAGKQSISNFVYQNKGGSMNSNGGALVNQTNQIYNWMSFAPTQPPPPPPQPRISPPPLSSNINNSTNRRSLQLNAYNNVSSGGNGIYSSSSFMPQNVANNNMCNNNNKTQFSSHMQLSQNSNIHIGYQDDVSALHSLSNSNQILGQSPAGNTINNTISNMLNNTSSSTTSSTNLTVNSISSINSKNQSNAVLTKAAADALPNQLNVFLSQHPQLASAIVTSVNNQLIQQQNNALHHIISNTSKTGHLPSNYSTAQLLGGGGSHNGVVCNENNFNLTEGKGGIQQNTDLSQIQAKAIMQALKALIPQWRGGGGGTVGGNNSTESGERGRQVLAENIVHQSLVTAATDEIDRESVGEHSIENINESKNRSVIGTTSKTQNNIKTNIS